MLKGGSPEDRMRARVRGRREVRARGGRVKGWMGLGEERRREWSITVITAGLRQGRSQKYPHARQLGTTWLQREERDDSRQSCCQSPVDQEGKCYGGLGGATVMSWAVILPFVRYEVDRRLLPPPLMPEEFFCTWVLHILYFSQLHAAGMNQTHKGHLDVDFFRPFLESGGSQSGFWFIYNQIWGGSGPAQGFFSLVKWCFFPSSAVRGSGSGFLCLQTILSITALI